ncbi:MAG: hypothetical protein GC147_13860 [Porphyrobacter sp.]|nr:hypothetical protein [Porphyrobacter sp.]
MENTLLELLIITGIFLALAIPAYLIFGEIESGPSEPPVPLSRLQSVMALQGTKAWSVTIVRRSGYIHDAWTYTGTALGALQTAQQKMRQAKLEDFAIRANTPHRFEVTAYFESAGRRRTGKYIGGFVIAAA